MSEWIKTSDLFGELTKSGESAEATVQLTTRDSEEKFSLWSAPEKKFYRDGDTITIDGKERDVNKYIKLTDEQKKKYNRSLKFTRELIWDGKEVKYDFPMSLEKALDKAINTVENLLKKDPLNYNYTLIKKRTGPEVMNVEYDAAPGEEINTEITDEPEIELELEDEGSSLNQTEEKIVNTLKTRANPEKLKALGEAKLVEQFTNNGISEERAKEIVAEHLLN